MRFLHTADWHLGKNFRGYSLLEDQHYILEEFLRLVDDTQPEAIIVAGDIYDRAVPPADAVLLLDEILTKIVKERKIPLLAIAGNHDSGGRLSFACGILEQMGLFLRGIFDIDAAPIILEDKFGEVAFSLFPYFDPAAVDASLRLDMDAAYEKVIAAAQAKLSGRRSVAVAHLFATGGTTSESERPLVVGGAGFVAPHRFAEYNYTALGHLHAPQRAGAENIRYSGSLLKYSFDEAAQKKGVILAEMDRFGAVTTQTLPLAPKKDVRIVEGFMEEIRRDRDSYPLSEDYVLVRLLDTTAILGAYDKLSEVYPNLSGVEFCGIKYRQDNVAVAARRENVSETELFGDFFREMTNEDLTDAQRKILDDCVREVYLQEREDFYATVNA